MRGLNLDVIVYQVRRRALINKKKMDVLVVSRYYDCCIDVAASRALAYPGISYDIFEVNLVTGDEHMIERFLID